MSGGGTQWKQAELEAVLYNPVCDASCMGGKIQCIQALLTLNCLIKLKINELEPKLTSTISEF